MDVIATQLPDVMSRLADGRIQNGEFCINDDHSTFDLKRWVLDLRSCLSRRGEAAQDVLRGL